jgi:hypothetical protein
MQWRAAYFAVWCAAGLACASAESSPVVVPDAAPALSAETQRIALVLRAADSLLLVHAANDARDIASAAVPRSADGLIGRNREWGAMYASRFQMGTGQALRVALAMPASSVRLADAKAAFAGIAAGVQGMESSGRLPARVPITVSMGQDPAPVDIASGAAFYLGDACLGVLALEASSLAGTVATSVSRRELRGRLSQAIRWLVTQAPVLLAGDQHAPNRLLFDARAYQACGILADDSTVRSAAVPFLAAWNRTVSPAGWFMEGDGWDTSYQAVSLDIGMDVVTVLPSGASRDTLHAALVQGAQWLRARVLPDGRVASGGNTRTCDGGESFLGTPKQLALTSVVMGLSRVAVNSGRTINESFLEAAQRVSHWARQNPSADPCFSGVS